MINRVTADKNNTTTKKINSLIIEQETNHPINMNSKKRKTCLPDSRLGFSAEANPRRKPISNVSNLRKGSYHRSYTLWKKV